MTGEERDRVQLVVYTTDSEDYRTITSRQIADTFMDDIASLKDYVRVSGLVNHPDANELVMVFKREDIRAAEYSVLKGV